MDRRHRFCSFGLVGHLVSDRTPGLDRRQKARWELLWLAKQPRVGSPTALQLAAVVSPMEQGLALARATGQVARLAVADDLPDVTPYGSPALNLAGILFGQSPADVISAIPLEPAAWVVGVDPAFLAPYRERLASIDSKIVE